MKRRVLIVLLLLVAGAIVNVAVAFISVRDEYDVPDSAPVLAAGWPLRVFEREHGDRGPGEAFWFGVTVNTLIFAGCLSLVVVTWLPLRNRSRIKRGLCPKCAYPVGTNKRCTECGVTVKSGAAAAKSAA